MECYKIENLSFTYPEREKAALEGISLRVHCGEIVTVCGKSGCGKTTLLRLLKSSLAPFGDFDGKIYFEEKPLSEYSARLQASKIGFVTQSPDNQIVCDKVWHELAFGLESLGFSTAEIRARVSEMAAFFGIQEWFHKSVNELSGGQKQLLNLASVMVMQPSVLILDEPTSQLDPIASQEFFRIIEKINRELGTTVILSEHRLEEAFPMSDKVVVMDGGKIIADDEPKKVGEILNKLNHDMYIALPVPVRVFGAVENNAFEAPLTVREGRMWLEKLSEAGRIKPDLVPEPKEPEVKNTVIEIKDIWFRYEKNLPDIIKGLSVSVKKGELFAIMGGNAAGKTTLLSLLSGLNTPYRGKIQIKGKEISQIKNLYDGVLGVLPQNPQTLFVKKTLFLDLMEILSEEKTSKEEKEKEIKAVASLCRIEELLESHPYDLSGGEQQRAALAKILLKKPEILLLDEPTKGMDADFKEIFAGILDDLKSVGVTVVMVSHDIEFCAEHADRCALVFDGGIASEGCPRKFFAGKSFYTTAANRMARTSISNAVLAEDIILACGANPLEKKRPCEHFRYDLPNKGIVKYIKDINEEYNNAEDSKMEKNKRVTPFRIIAGILFFALFIFTCKYGIDTKWQNVLIQFASIFEIAACLACVIPQKKFEIKEIRQPKNNRSFVKRTAAAALMVLIFIPLTIFVGMFYLEDKKYYFISILIILETILPFCMVFESRKPEPREMIVISVLCAVAVAGRAAFFMLPQFKPVAAVVIISGVCFGGETGFLVGVIAAFVSNFFFGQGPLTPWQMFSFGIIGFIAGVLLKKGFLRKTKLSLCIFGFLTTLIIYGGIMNPASVILWQPKPTAEMFISAYAMGLPFDLIHAASSAFFLWFISEPMIDKLERIKNKYGLLEK